LSYRTKLAPLMSMTAAVIAGASAAILGISP
jgi:hypothetical protein